MSEFNGRKCFMEYCKREPISGNDYIKKQYSLITMSIFTEHVTVKAFFNDLEEAHFDEADFVGIYSDTIKIVESIQNLGYKVLDIHTNKLNEGYALTQSLKHIEQKLESHLQLFKWRIINE